MWYNVAMRALTERKRSDLGRLLGLMLAHWRAIALGVLGLIGVDVLQLIVPQVVRRAVDELASGTATLRLLVVCGAGISAAALGMGACRFVWRYFLIGSSHRIERGLRQRLYEHLLTLPPEYYDHHKVGDIMSHATNDTHAVRRAVGFAALAAIDGAFMAAAVLSMMLWMNVPLTLVTLLPLPFLALVMLRFGRLIHERFERVQASFSAMTDRAQEAFSGVRVIKAYGDEASEQRLFAARARQYASDTIRMARVWAFFDPVIAALATASMALLMWWGGRGVLAGTLTLGEFVAFTSYLGMFTWPMIAVGIVVNMMQRGAASMGRIQAILDTQAVIRDGTHRHTPAPHLICHNLTYTYPGATAPALRGISFELPPRATLGIVGRTGAGKTTLLELLMRLYDPPPGTVCLDGVDIRDLPLATLRGMFAYVPQEPFLFAMSVADNIRFGQPDMPMDTVQQLARQVGLDEEIAGFPQGYDTLVGERGITLSGGQKQRVAIARALALHAPFLVLDDALSSVDAETEALILSHLRAQSGSMTTIIVAHRVSAVKDAGLILVMDNGMIIDRGTHAELISRAGYYRELYDLQRIEAAELAGK